MNHNRLSQITRDFPKIMLQKIDQDAFWGFSYDNSEGGVHFRTIDIHFRTGILVRTADNKTWN